MDRAFPRKRHRVLSFWVSSRKRRTRKTIRWGVYSGSSLKPRALRNWNRRWWPGLGRAHYEGFWVVPTRRVEWKGRLAVVYGTVDREFLALAAPVRRPARHDRLYTFPAALELAMMTRFLQQEADPEPVTV